MEYQYGAFVRRLGEGVTAKDVHAMCEFAEGEAGFEIQEQGNESEKGALTANLVETMILFVVFPPQKGFLCADKTI